MDRPSISAYSDPSSFIEDMIVFRKKTEAGFTVARATQSLRKVSPTLVSLILKRKRKVTFDRVDEISKLLNLNPAERLYFRNWVGATESRSGGGAERAADSKTPGRSRKDVGTGILSDWINVYVKDFFQIPATQKNPDLIEAQLRSVASPQRVKKAIQFLLREGYLRRALDGRIVIETNLAVADPRVSSQKIRQFHKGALTLAKQALDLYPPHERLANTLVIPLGPKGHGKMLELIEEFADKLKDLAAENEEPGERMYQLVINLSPVGGPIK